MGRKGKITGRSWIPLLLVVSGMFVFHGRSAGQEIPDGTQGELMEKNKSDTIVTDRKFADWNKFDGPLTTLKLGVGFLLDFVAYAQDSISKKQVSPAEAVKVRDFRITLSGRFKFKRDVTWKAGIMYDGATNSWFLRESGVMISVPEISSKFFIGRTKEGFSLEKIMVGYAIWGMERSMAIDVIPILADGVKWLGYLPKQRILWDLGVFVNWLSKDQSFSTYSWQAIGRLGWLPVYSASGKTVLHIAIDARYGRPEGKEIRVRSRPEVNSAPYFVDTDVFPANYSFQFGGEAYFSTGRWMFGSEYYGHKFFSTETNNPLFWGGEVVASCFITGEVRPYIPSLGIYSFVNVKKPVFKGGPGAWEALLQFTNIDLDGGTLKGGRFWRITPGISWYLSNQVRLDFQYGYGVLDRFNMRGGTHFFQGRIQLMI